MNCCIQVFSPKIYFDHFYLQGIVALERLFGLGSDRLLKATYYLYFFAIRAYAFAVLTFVKNWEGSETFSSLQSNMLVR